MANPTHERHHFVGAMYRIALSDSGAPDITSLIHCLLVNNVNVEVADHPKHWKLVTYRSSKPLLKETDNSAHEFAYQFLIRESEDRFILLSAENSLVDMLIHKARLTNLVQLPRIDIDRLVRDIVWPPEGDGKHSGRRFLMGGVWAAVAGEGRVLRSTSFFGDDLAEGHLFQKALSFDEPKVSPYRVILKDPETKTEIVNIGSNGELSIYYRGARHLAEIEVVMRFLTRNGYVKW